MGMTAVCSGGCGYSARSDSHRGARLGNCPQCGKPMRAHTAGRAKGRYICPISGNVVTLGLSSVVQLDQPMRLAFHPGVAPPYGRQIDDPSELGQYTRASWERAKDLVLGPGCVVGYAYQLPKPGEYGYGLADIYLTPAPDSDPATWFVNEPVKYKKCAACPSRVVVSDETRMPEPWSPRRSWYWVRYGRRAETADTNPGPHPAGTFACGQCDPRKVPEASQ